MGKADYYKSGGWNSRCQECGEKYKFDQLRLRWDFFYVCWRCFENRNPQDFLRGFPDLPAAPLTTSDPPFPYVGTFLEEPNPNLFGNVWMQGGKAGMIPNLSFYTGLLNTTTMG